MKEKIKEILKERGNLYGNYDEGCSFRVQVMCIIKNRHLKATGKRLNLNYVECFHDIINKLSRLAVTPTHIDSWRDIIGYAELIIETIEDRRKRNAD